MQDSLELRLLENGEFADYRDPNKRKDREFFQVDPSQTSWENIKRGLALDTDNVRRVLTGAGGYVAMMPRVIFAHWEVAGSIVGKIGKAFGAGKEFDEAVTEATKADESTRIFIDEVFTSAKSEHMALSEFYSDKVNAKLYDFSLNYAQSRSKQLHLGLLEGRKNYEGKVYLLGALDLADMRRFYDDAYVKKGKTDKDIEKAIDDKMKEEEKAKAKP